MISDEPDEDADLLDDEAALETYLGDAPPKSDSANPAAPQLPDWPRRAVDGIGLNLDAETLTWFKAAGADWRGQIRSVLRAWVAAKAAERQTTGQAEPVAEPGRPEDLTRNGRAHAKS
jgi:uncharacterized protein (DUF4415 family)